MTDGNDVSGQQAAQPAIASQGAPPAGSTLSPDLIKVLRGEIKNVLGEFSREQQSQRDKMEARISGRVQEMAETFKTFNGGQDLTPEQRDQLRKIATKQIGEQPEHEQQASPQQAAQPTQRQEPSHVEKLILKKFEKAGITIEDGDPELTDLKNIDPTDLDDLKEKIDAAIEKKRARLQNKPSNLNPDAVSRVSAATVTGTPTDLENQYKVELGKIRRGDVNAIYDLKTKYRKLGLKVE